METKKPKKIRASTGLFQYQTRTAELVELALNAHSTKLAKVSERESQIENVIKAELLATDEGVLPHSIHIDIELEYSNLSLVPEVTFPDICNYLLGKTDEYSEETLKSFKSFCLRDRGRLGNEVRPISLKIGTQCCYVDLCNMPKFQLQ